jgi:Undecaprenyl-phosphate galactose phosphotransferase WbaP
MRQHSSRLLLADILALLLAFFVGQLLRLMEFNYSFDVWWIAEGQFRVLGLFLIFMGFLLGFGFFYQHYSQRKPFWDELREILSTLLIILVVDAAFFFFNKIYFSRLAFAVQWLLLISLLPTLRTLLKLYSLKRGTWQIPIRMIGSGINAHEAWLALKSEGLMGYQLVEVVLTNDKQPDWVKVPILTWDDGLKPTPEMQVVVALEAEQQSELNESVRRLYNFCPNMIIVPPTRGLPLWGMESLHSFSHEVLLLRARNNLLRPSSRLIKRLFDIVTSSVLLILLSPVFAVLFYKVHKTDGDAFYGHRRVGVTGVPFPCYKFRTMVKNSAEVLAQLLRDDPVALEQWEREFKLKDDPRITPIGHFLRRTSLDELPQLWNVLRGDMSLVGPRPVVEAELEKYGDDVDYYLHVKPGMTGLWQVSGRNDVDYETRVALDAWYVRNWSLWNDLVILIKTVRVVLQKEGAY